MADNTWNAPMPQWGDAVDDYDFGSLKTTRNRAFDNKNINYIYRKLRDRGFDNLRIAAILGTIVEESGGNPYAVSPDGKFSGLMQWEGSRYSINPFMATDPRRELDRQIDYIVSSLDNTTDQKSWTHGGAGSGYGKAIEAHDEFRKSDDLQRIVYALNRGYVRPAGKNDSVNNRHNVASQILETISVPASIAKKLK